MVYVNVLDSEHCNREIKEIINAIKRSVEYRGERISPQNRGLIIGSISEILERKYNVIYVAIFTEDSSLNIVSSQGGNISTFQIDNYEIWICM